jgi:transposase
MAEYISFDSHKHYTWAEREDVQTEQRRTCRINHAPGAIREYLKACEPGTPVALEATANWYWIVQEIEEAGLAPRLVHPRKAKLMMGMTNKSDKLDAHGMNVLQRNKTLPTVWIPPAEVRDLRELTRTRMVLAHHRTRLKNRITATLAKYAASLTEYSDPYGVKARQAMQERIAQLPTQTRFVTGMLLQQLDFVVGQIEQMEGRLKPLIQVTPEMEWLMTLPGVALILGAVTAWEIGDVTRFATAERLASYSGTTPRVWASGDKVRYGPLRCDVNQYLKWAFAEAANSVAVNHERCPGRHVSQLYRRLRARKGHSKAIGAVARHLAEAAWHVLSRREPYRDPALKSGPLREV